MRNNNILQFIAVFLGMILSFGQESKELFDLKSKLTLVKNDEDKVKLIDEISNKYSEAKNIDSALVYAKKSLPIYQKLNNIEKIGRSNLFIGNLLIQKMDIVNSEKYLIEAEKFLNKTENYEKRALTYYFLATINSVNKNVKIANDYCNQILSLNNQKKIKDKKLVLVAYQRLFQNNFVQENPVEGYKSLNTYIEFTKTNFPEYLHEANNLAGMFYLQNKDFKKASNYFQESLQLANKSKDELKIANSKMFLGNIYSETKQYEKAIVFLEEARQYFEIHKLNENLKMIYYYLSDINYKQKKYEIAENEIDKSLKLSNDKDPMRLYYLNPNSAIGKSIILAL